MEPMETVNVFMDLLPKLESPNPEPDTETVLTCKLCLAPQSAARLARRDLTSFYCTFRPCGLGLDITGSPHYDYVCQYCWVRAAQCLKFIECALKAEHVLNNVFKHTPITEKKLINICRSYITPPVQLSLCSLGTKEQEMRRKSKRQLSSDWDHTQADDSDSEDSIALTELCRVEVEERKATLKESQPVVKESQPTVKGSQPAAKKSRQVVKVKRATAKGKTRKKSLKEQKTPKVSAGKKPRKDPAELVARWRALEVEVMKLSEAEQLAELERRRRAPRYLQWRHKCERCAVGFHEEVSLQRHNLAHDEARGPYECQICHVRFPKQHQLSSHAGGHKRRWRCLRCGETILKNDYLEAHRAKCTGSPPIRCDTCGKFFSNKLRLRQHVSSSHNARRRHICDTCGREFKAKHHIRYHMRIHTGEMPYQCELCGKKSSTSTSHRIHMTVHNKKTENPEAYCVECDKYFKNKNILQIHYQRSLKHNTKDSFPHACTECDERYPAAAALRIHINSAHLKSRAFRCTLCDKAYYSRGTLAVHVRDKHVGRERTRQHVCTVCRRAFLTSSQLKAHTRIHTKERPYVCPLCPSTFTFNSGLYTHTKNKHKVSTAELKSRLGLAALGTPHAHRHLLQRQSQQLSPATFDALGPVARSKLPSE